MISQYLDIPVICALFSRITFVDWKEPNVRAGANDITA